MRLEKLFLLVVFLIMGSGAVTVAMISVEVWFLVSHSQGGFFLTVLHTDYSDLRKMRISRSKLTPRLTC